METTNEKKNQDSLKQKGELNQNVPHTNESVTKFMTLSWNKDNSDIKSFIRGGRVNLGCGWCGHSNPEG